MTPHVVYSSQMDVGTHSPEHRAAKSGHGSPDRGQEGKNTMKQYYITSNVNDRNATAKSLANGEKFDVWFTSGTVRHYDEQGDLISTESATMPEDVERIDPTAEEIVEAVAQKVSESKTRSAWERGVKAYAEELVEELREAVEGGYIDESDLSNRRLFERAMLNGAADWKQYSEGGSALCYDCQIAERLCAPWELRKTDGGCKDPNPRESWIDVQSRALTQAARLVLRSAF